MASPLQPPHAPTPPPPPPPPPHFGQGQDLQAWIRTALERPYNPSESNSNRSIQQYDNLAPVWERTFLASWYHNEVIETFSQELRAHLPLGPEAIVLDLGGATGMLARFLVASGLARKVISIDISPRMTEQARQGFQSFNLQSEKATGKPIHWELVAACADMTKPIKNKPGLNKHLSDGVDVVVSLRAFSNLPPATATRTLETMRTLLRPGGRILLDNNPPRPFLRHIVCIPKAFGKSPNHPKLLDIIAGGLVDSSVLVCDAESSALVNLQKASLEHLARQSGLTLHHMTPGHLPEGAVNTSTDFLSHLRKQLKNRISPYDEISAPPDKMFQALQETYGYLLNANAHKFDGKWKEEAGMVDSELQQGYVGYPEHSTYYGVFGHTVESTDQD